VGEDQLVRLGVAFDELGCGELILLKYFVKIIWRCHLERSPP
jgi:hypothetical protein